MTALPRLCRFFALALVLSAVVGCGDNIKNVPPPDQSNVDPAKLMKDNKNKPR
jgi:hypothetical protein